MTLTRAQVQEAVADLGWRDILGEIQTYVATGSFAAGVRLVERVGLAADAANHHPDVDLRYPGVTFTLTSHDVGGLTQRDVDMARTITTLAREAGHEPDPSRAQGLEVAIDAIDIPAVLPFWRAALGYVDDGDDALRDPRGIGTPVWFQQSGGPERNGRWGRASAPAGSGAQERHDQTMQMDVPRPQRNRIHLDITVPYDEAPSRIDATLAAGGRMLDHGAAPRFVVLADPEGNEACLCTSQGR